MQTRTVDLYPVGHQRHNHAENTPDSIINAFYRSTPMHHCKPYGATIRGAVCQKRRALAFSTPRKAWTGRKENAWRTDAIMRLDRCLVCKSYWKPSPAPVPAKHGVCSCGCGRDGRLVGRGMLSGCYQRYLRGRRAG